MPSDTLAGGEHVEITHSNFPFDLCCRFQQNKRRVTESDQQHEYTWKRRLMINYKWDSRTKCEKIYDRLQSDR